MSSHFNTPEFDHKAFAKYLAENKLTSSSRLHSLNEGIEEAVPFEKDALDEELTVADINKKYTEMLKKNNLVLEDYLPYGAFPAYFYIFTGIYFKTIGKGLNLNKIIFPYFLGQFILTPFLWFHKKLNLSMQTVVCRIP